LEDAPVFTDIERMAGTFKILETNDNCPTITRRQIGEFQEPSSATKILQQYSSNKIMQPSTKNKFKYRFQQLL
jgi:hypothetical protein